MVKYVRNSGIPEKAQLSKCSPTRYIMQSDSWSNGFLSPSEDKPVQDGWLGDGLPWDFLRFQELKSLFGSALMDALTFGGDFIERHGGHGKFHVLSKVRKD